MRVASVDGRVHVLDPGERALAIDVAAASKNYFGSAIDAIYPRWQEFCAWVAAGAGEGGRIRWPPDGKMCSLVVAPRQLFAIGLNYADHAEESGASIPEFPPVFTKFASSLAGADTVVELPDDEVDWEVELVVILGRTARRIRTSHAWSYVAGLTVGQDISSRSVQLRPPMPQFSLGKSFPGFAPIGPILITPDECRDPDDLEIICRRNGVVVQHARTRDMILGVPRLIASLSEVLTLYPGDAIFTGTPAGVALGRRPQDYLRPGDVLESEIESIGCIRQRFVAGVG